MYCDTLIYNLNGNTKAWKGNLKSQAVAILWRPWCPVMEKRGRLFTLRLIINEIAPTNRGGRP